MKRIIAKITACLCAIVLAGGVLAACSSGASPVNSEQQANRSYMSQVNEVMDQLRVELASFNEAVSRGDIVNMRTQADNAFKVLDRLSGLEVPDSLKDVQEDYLDGAKKLREALDQFITLYTEIDAGTFDQSTYSTRIQEIQSLYDQGVEALKKGDEAAASKQ